MADIKLIGVKHEEPAGVLAQICVDYLACVIGKTAWDKLIWSKVDIFCDQTVCYFNYVTYVLRKLKHKFPPWLEAPVEGEKTKETTMKENWRDFHTMKAVMLKRLDKKKGGNLSKKIYALLKITEEEVEPGSPTVAHEEYLRGAKLLQWEMFDNIVGV